MPRLKLDRPARFRSQMLAVMGAVSVGLCSGTEAFALTWDSGGASPGSPSDGGGTWNLSLADWSNLSTDQIWPDNATTATFGNDNGVAGTVNLSVPITAGGLIFNAPGSGNYNLTGSALTLTTGAIQIFSTSPTIAATISGSAGLTLSGSGSLTLSGSNNYSGTTNVNGGTLTAAAASAIPGGAVVVGSSGTLNLNASNSFANVFNNGVFTIAAGQTLSLSNSFQQAGGTLNINGSLGINGATFNYTSGTINGTVTMNGSSPTLYLGPSANSGTFLFNNSGSFVNLATSTIPAGVTVLVQPAGLSLELESPSPLTNSGTLKLTSANSGTINVETNLINNGSFTTSAAGTPSGPMSLESFTNNTADTAAFNTSATVANVLNNGTLSIAAGQTLSLSNSFQQAGGTLNINGSLGINGATFNYTSGTINGTVTMNGSSPTLYLGPSANSGTFLFNNSGSFVNLATSTIPAGVTVLVQPAGLSLELESPSPLTNSGTLKLTSANSGTINVETNLINNGSFTTSAAGTPSGPMSLESFTNNTADTAAFNTSATVANVLNNGTLSIAAGQTLSLSNSFQQAGGTLNINGSLGINGATFNYTSGTINGTVTMNGSSPTLYLGPSANSGTFLFNNSGSFVNLATSTIPAGVTVLVQPGGSNPELESPSPLTNSGTFIVSATGTVTLPSFINSASATTNFNKSTGINGNLINLGALNINAALTLNSTSDSFQQSGGTTTVASGITLNSPNSSGFIINGGTINLASAASSPAQLEFPSLLWPNPPSPANPATDLASINALPYVAPQIPGRINLAGIATAFDIADPAATLTIAAEIYNGTVNKTGPGTLVVNGPIATVSQVNVQAGVLTLGVNATFTVSTPIVVSAGATLNVQGSIPNEHITNNGTVNFPTNNSSGINVVSISNLNLSTGQTSVVSNPSTHAGRTLLEIGALGFGGTTNTWQGQLDLTGNDLDLPGGSLTNTTNQIKLGYNGGTWTGANGIVSSVAAADSTHLTALGVIQNNQGGTALYGNGSNQKLFDGIAPGATDVLVKFTYYGDTDLSGTIDGTDYSRIDSSFNTEQTTGVPITGWFNGDFNYDGVVDGSDYTLIDNAFNSQSALPASSLASSPQAIAATQIAGTSSVPEPATAAFLCLAATGLLSRRRRRARKI